MCFSYFVIEIYILLSLRKLFKKKLNSMHKLTFSERWCPCLFPVATIKPWLKADSRSLLHLQSFKWSQGRNGGSRGQRGVMLTGLFCPACSACLFNTSLDSLPRGGTELSKFITNLKYVPQTFLRGGGQSLIWGSLSLDDSSLWQVDKKQTHRVCIHTIVHIAVICFVVVLISWCLLWGAACYLGKNCLCWHCLGPISLWQDDQREKLYLNVFGKTIPKGISIKVLIFKSFICIL